MCLSACISNKSKIIHYSSCGWSYANYCEKYFLGTVKGFLFLLEAK